MDVFTYRPAEVNFIVCGYEVTGWTSISISRNAPVFKQIRGIRGKNTRVLNRDTSATIRLSLVQTAVANDVFSELLTGDRASGTSLEVVIKDTAGTSLFSSTTAYISAFPDVRYSASQTEREWTILCDSMDGFVVGGNAEQGLDFLSILSRLTS